MKKLILLFLAFFTLVTVQAQREWAGCIIEQVTPGAEDMVWENDSIRFSFLPSDGLWYITIRNKTSSKIKCLWDDSHFDGSRIVFDDTINFLKDAPKGEERIFPESSIIKRIFPLNHWRDSGRRPIYKKKDIKKYGDKTVRLLFSISYGEEVKEYKFEFKISLAKKEPKKKKTKDISK